MDAILAYAQGVQSEFKTQIAREHAYRPHLKQLLEAMENGLTAVNDPKHSEGGAPDFIVLRGVIPIAFLEAKDIGVSLDKVSNSTQMGRYREHYGNLILTNYLEFRWYVDGEQQEQVVIGEKREQGLVFDANAYSQLESMMGRYIHTLVPTVNSAEQLAQKMAGLARDIAKLIVLYLADSKPSPQLQQQKIIFEQELIPSLSNEQFADMYAQTLAYGLFASRVNYVGKPENFTLKNAFWELPNTNPFLKKLFQNLATDLDERVQRWGEAIAQLLARTKIDDILANFGKRTQQTDPVIHFYETFLGAYNPKEREKRGVYYTPEPVVGYIVRSVDHVLRTAFQRNGLADKNTLILDPATGTGTFLYFVIQHIHEQLVTLGGQGGRWNAYVSENLLKRVFGFELLMAPYSVAHMKLQILLKELGYDFKTQERLGVYLTNALEPLQDQQQLKEGLRAQLSDEAKQAADVKDSKPIMVVLGNPPYSGHSSNLSKDPKIAGKDKRTWIGRLLEPYFMVDGKRLDERNPKWLNDDYVKFIRMGQERIERTGHGVLAFVTNHGYLDNPTFRGMRQSLMHTFSDIYILDLHGNSKKKEKSPDGSPDKNVFDIQQGVAIGIFVKNPAQQTSTARVHHYHLWGNREGKYTWLNEHQLADTDWTEVKPSAPFYLFVPQDVSLRDEYEQNWKINDIFPINSVGIVTGQDSKTIAMTESESFEQAEKFNLPSSTSKLILYRPFDTRYIIYDDKVVTRSRRDVMKHMLRGKNLALCLGRSGQAIGSESWEILFCGTHISELNLFRRGGNNLFPLYIYRDGNKFEMPAEDEFAYDEHGRRPNLSVRFVRQLENALNATFVFGTAPTDNSAHTFSPEDIFHYVYAMFHSPTYRARYAEFLKVDFPRLPLPKTWDSFCQLVQVGASLTQYHLMTHPDLHQHGQTFPQSGTDMVDKSHPKWQDGRVYINKTQFFGNVSESEWQFSVGGYQVLHKWLKDRVGRKLSDDELTYYQHIIKAIRETTRLMQASEAWM
jgi:predicted helicase